MNIFKIFESYFRYFDNYKVSWVVILKNIWDYRIVFSFGKKMKWEIEEKFKLEFWE